MKTEGRLVLARVLGWGTEWLLREGGAPLGMRKTSKN
jgi:hypothetical protein